MKKLLMRIPTALKAARELGSRQVFWYAVYQIGLRSGLYQRATPPGRYQPMALTIQAPFTIPDRIQLAALLREQAAEAILEANEIAGGKVRLFGGPPVKLKLAPKNIRHHWSFYEARSATWGVEDLKFLWEPARFGWVYPLGRAYLLTGSEIYPQVFWRCFESFLQANPPNQGPNWASAQEVALRLLALLFAARIFAGSPNSTLERMSSLAGALAAHAHRIPPTLSYARAQNNNHRVSEALGLYAIGHALREHPQAKGWRELGWRELNRALTEQISAEGTYTQHSLNYHRLMLQAALQAGLFGQEFPLQTLDRLALATTWLLAQVDPHTGKAPNLGSNDGAYILPLAPGGFSDYRPVAQAAARAFLGQPAFPPGPWDELGLWLNQPQSGQPMAVFPPYSPAIHRLGDGDSWATLRAVHFHGRPSHADQLHVDLWWQGENIALDAGTYRYTAPPPWDNSLGQTFVHNTLEINGQNQMQRAGRFLWLDWAQAELLPLGMSEANALAAQHDGYQHLGVIHRRVLKQTSPNHWQVIDYVLRSPTLRMDVPQNPLYPVRLHWLLPDWPWQLDGQTLTLSRPGGGQVILALSADVTALPQAKIESVSLVRAGEALVGPKKVSRVLGWFSPTYSVKVPALSFAITVQSPLPFTLLSDWSLDAEAHRPADKKPTARKLEAKNQPAA